MGHLRLRELPRTRSWKQVVGLIEGGADVSQVAQATLDAAEKALALAGDDPGLVDSLWLLMQLPLAARSDDFGKALREVGINAGDAPSLLDITSGFADEIDRRVANRGGRTDLTEMAQMAATEAVASLVSANTPTLFDAGPEDVQNALRKLGTQKRFGELARQVFSRLANRCLGYYLSRTLATHVGESRRFASLAEQSAFSTALGKHCYEASKIVETFSGDWLSKTVYEQGGVSRDEAAKFAYGAFRKLTSELRMGAAVANAH